jgi:hypothetical protein
MNTTITDYNAVNLTVCVAAPPTILRRDEQNQPAFVTAFCLRVQTQHDGVKTGTKMPITIKANDEQARTLAECRSGTQLTVNGRLGCYTNTEKKESFFILAGSLSDIILARKSTGTAAAAGLATQSAS